ncbi:MAG: hydantoinase B/oxoprolinase family protein, partial [Alphaproteobacteria bacterium]|nr:hydantoinase B/oxoprolinase family protein [Alphaproteobacteria bacterium]
MNLDPVLLAVIQNRLDHITTQMGWVMMRTARSPIFSISHDFSCFITGPDGQLVSQADGSPIHTGGGGFAIRALLKAFDGSIGDGDAFILSDPYLAGGNHLPDWVVAQPVFVDQALVAFTCNRAHQSDIGGGAAGTYNPNATEIWHEGIRLPPLRLIERGKARADLWQLLLANTRCPGPLDGDLRAMLGSTRIGAEQIAALVSETGVGAGLAYLEGILAHADRRMRAAIADLPDGTYRGEDGMDNDCFTSVETPFRVALTVAGDGLTVDFTGTGPQMKGFKNSSLVNTHSAVYMALTAFLDPAIPRNEGTFRSVRIIAPEGSAVNPRPPAAVTMGTAFPAYEIIHACWQALSRAVPNLACAGWGKPMHPLTAGDDGHGERYVLYHWLGLAGSGAVHGRDGFNQISHLVSLGGLMLPNVEAFEQTYPIRIARQSFRCDGGGPGEWRGGSGIEYEVDVNGPGEHAFRGEGQGRP